MRTNVLLAWLSLLLAYAANATTVAADRFFKQLTTESDMVAHAVASQWHPQTTTLLQAFRNPSVHRIIKLTPDIRNNASGINGSVWQFSNTALNQRFTQLFQTIASMSSTWGFNVDLNADDLFHGHVFVVTTKQNQAQDIGIVFHAKEYPRDLAAANNNRGLSSKFTTHDQAYKDRNFIWLASTGTIYDLDGDNPELYPSYFLPNGWNAPVDDPDLGQITKQFLQARTFLLERLDGHIERLDDINYFYTTHGPLLFFTYQPKSAHHF